MEENPVKEAIFRFLRVLAAGAVTLLVNSQTDILGIVGLIIPDKIEALVLPLAMAGLLALFKFLRTKFPESAVAKVL
ncbi:MAG: hypothetical protein ACRDGM_16375 [bacterium]